MDIYSYLNSPDIADHCRNINHPFNALESAFIINDCQRISIEEKHRLYREITETMPDMELPRQIVMLYDLKSNGLFDNLRRLIRDEERLLSEIRCGGKGVIYTFSAILKGSRDFETSPPFSDFEQVMCAIRNHAAECEEECYGYRIMMQKAGTDELVRVFLNSQKEITYYCEEHRNTPVQTFLDDLWVCIPTPFQNGDIVCMVPCVYRPYQDTEPLLLDRICYWGRDDEWISRRKQDGDNTDMTAFVYGIDENGDMWNDCMHEYHHLCRYTGELFFDDRNQPKDYRLLKAVSAYMKGEIDLHMLLIAENALRARRHWHSLGWQLEFRGCGFQNAGFGDLLEKMRLLFDAKNS